MSRHRNVRNLDEDDYDDYYDEDEDDGAYYLQQQREKEKRQKEEAAKRVKAKQANKLKQQQQQQQKQKLQQSNNNSTASKTNSTVAKGGISVAASAGDSVVKQTTTGISATNPPPGFSVTKLPSPGFSTVNSPPVHWSLEKLPPPDFGSVEALPQDTTIISLSGIGECSSSSRNNNSDKRLPQPIPPHVLSILQSINANHASSDTNNKISSSNISSSSSSSTNNATLRSHLSLVIIGHVDAGKSTLTGRLLLTLNHVTRRQYQKHQKSSSQIGKSSFALAWFTDEDDTERERGVTIDVATKCIQTSRYDITLLDSPGHRDFVPNMITGAASADVGLLVVASTTGEFEAGFADGTSSSEGDGGGNNGSTMSCGQTREHVTLSRGLGVKQFIVAINKLDVADPPWSQKRYEYIKTKVLDFLKKSGYRDKQIKFVPVSGLSGVNVNRTDECNGEDWKALRKWYSGPTLVEALDSFNPAKREFDKPLRVIVSDVSSEGKNVSVRGRVAQGFVRMGDTIVILPVGDEATVIRVEREKAVNQEASPYSFAPTEASKSESSTSNVSKSTYDIKELQDCALAGDIVEVTLSGIDPARISPGCVLCHTHLTLRPKVKRKFEARILVMERLVVPIIRGSQVLLHMHSLDVPAVLSRLISSERRGDSTPRLNPRVVAGGVTATVEITLSEKLVIEESNECKALGRFVLRRGGDTIAVGLIDKVLD
jgi:elongation factor 1 alpha-like protein